MPSNRSNIDDYNEEGKEEDNENCSIAEEDQYPPEEVKIVQQIIEFDELKIGDFLISAVPVGDKNQSEHFVARINDIESKDKITVEFLKQNYNVRNVFGHYDNEKEQNSDIEFNDIVMILKKPISFRRNRYIFENEINLK